MNKYIVNLKTLSKAGNSSIKKCNNCAKEYNAPHSVLEIESFYMFDIEKFLKDNKKQFHLTKKSIKKPDALSFSKERTISFFWI